MSVASGAVPVASSPVPVASISSLEHFVSSEEVATHINTLTDLRTEIETVSCSTSISAVPASKPSYHVAESHVPASGTAVPIPPVPTSKHSALKTEAENITSKIILTVQRTETLTAAGEVSTFATSASETIKNIPSSASSASSASSSSDQSESTGISMEYTDGSLGRQVSGIFKSFSVIAFVMLFI